MKSLLLLVVAGVLMCNSPNSKTTRWELAQFRHLIFNCLDTVHIKSWHDEQLVTSSYFELERIQKKVLEENDGKVVSYYLTTKGKVQKLSDGLASKGSFLMKDAHSGEFYEEKIIERNSHFLITSSEPGSLDIFFNPSSPPDSLTASQINRYMVQSGKLFGRTIPYCK